MSDDDNLNAALYHNSAGCPIIPVTQDKKPYFKGWKEYFCRQQTEQEVRRLLSNGAHGIAMVLWPASNYVVLDFDGPHAEEALRATAIELPETAVMKTRSGGTHHYFKMSPTHNFELKRRVRLIKASCDCVKSCGVDLLVHGYACVPPTPGYTEDPDHPLEDAVTIPSKVLDLAKTKPQGATRITGDAHGCIRDGQRTVTACSLAGTMRARGMSIDAMRAALRVDNEKRFDPPLKDREIEGILKSASGWPTGNGERPEHLTDLGNARRLVHQYGQELRYCNQRGWFIWDDRRWEPDDTGAVERFAKAAVRGIYNEAGACDDKDLRERIASHAYKSESDSRIKSMITLAKTEPEVVVRLDELDRDPWLLNLNNGTLDLSTGELKPHSRKNLITKLIPIDYYPDAVCPTWLGFLERITDGNTELIRFLQKAIGYSLTAITREQCFFILYGNGANGKSTFLNMLSALLGDYGRQTRTETLLVKRGDQIPNDIARLAGSRFVCAVETENGRRLAEGLIKQMTGCDRMTARFLHREFFEFEPTFKLWLAVNHKPKVRGSDHAVWRRIRLIPFTVTIPEAERDSDLSAKLRVELPGILAWSVKGCELWQSNGLKPPKTVAAATEDYRKEADVIAAFLDEACNEGGPDCEISKAGLYEAYMDWCKKSGEYPVTKKDFGIRLLEKGVNDGRNKNGWFWRGIELNGDTS